MPRVLIRTADQATPVSLPPGFAGEATSSDYFADYAGPDVPLRLHAFELSRATSLNFLAQATDRIVYLWKGDVDVQGHPLHEGSSFIVEHGAQVRATGDAHRSVLLVFAAATPERQQRTGGRVHLLPTQSVPRASLGAPNSVSGGMHADSNCSTCEVWLHENSFPGASDAQRADPEAGLHSHSEDEIIFVTAGQIRLGARLFGPGTALRSRPTRSTASFRGPTA